MNRPNERVDFVHDFLAGIFAGDLHAKRVASLANGALGVMTSASLAVSIIGHSLAQARGLLGKHAIKQVDRLLSNQGIVVWDLFAAWVTQVIGQRKAIVVAMDWTDFDADSQTTLAELLPDGVAVTILADRGFGDTKLFGFLETLGFNYVIRFRGNIHVTAADGETRAAAAWVGRGGRARKLRNAEVTAGRHKVGAVVCVHARDMKAAWCLAASNAEATAREITNYYARRWTIEPGFRDTKDLRFGMGLGVLRIADPYRRDRLLLLNAFAIVLLTLLGAAGESLGMDRHLKVNTAKRRTHSLFRQGCMLYELIPNMPEVRLRPLVERFGLYINQHPALNQTFSCV
jgi:hypothetical protein